MELKQTKKPSPKCPNCKKYLEWNGGYDDKGNQIAESIANKATLIWYYCNKCYARYEIRAKSNKCDII